MVYLAIIQGQNQPINAETIQDYMDYINEEFAALESMINRVREIRDDFQKARERAAKWKGEAGENLRSKDVTRKLEDEQREKDMQELAHLTPIVLMDQIDRIWKRSVRQWKGALVDFSRLNMDHCNEEMAVCKQLLEICAE
eukprot:162372_1